MRRKTRYALGMLDHLLSLILVLAVMATIVMIVIGLYLFLTAIWSLARDWRSSRQPKPKPCIYCIPPYTIAVHWQGHDELRVTIEDWHSGKPCRAPLRGNVMALYPEDQRPATLCPSEHVVSLPHHWLFVGTAHRLPLGLEPEYLWEASRPGVCTHGSATRSN